MKIFDDLLTFDVKNDKNIVLNMEKCKYLLSDDILWRNYVEFSREKYKKVTLLRNVDFELVLITWLPNQHTKLHSHPSNGCLMKVLYGQLHEIIYQNKTSYQEKNNKQGEYSFICDKLGKHVISNIENSPAVSLHLYSPPNFYD